RPPSPRRASTCRCRSRRRGRSRAGGSPRDRARARTGSHPCNRAAPARCGAGSGGRGRTARPKDPCPDHAARGTLRHMAAAVISWIVTGFITGALARLALPGPDPMPIWLTVAIGLGGSAVGGAIALGIAGRDPAWISIGGFLATVVIVGLYR